MIASPDNKTLQFIDNGIGMTAEEVEKYINQIAFSGAAAFLEQYKDKATEEQIIGHFGLGFNTGTDIAKIAMMPEDGSQVVDMMQAAKELQESGNQTPLIVISMGELGVSTRTTGEMYGNCISFATAGIPSAPGQIDVEALRSQLEMIHNIIGS